jgi:hypothetical protein
MAHILDGDWRSTFINPKTGLSMDRPFHFEIDERTGRVIPERSTHGGRNIKNGNANHGNVHSISVLDDADDLYEGELVMNFPIPNGGLMMLYGKVTFNRVRSAAERKGEDEGGSAEKDKRKFDGQEQVIWVATKP